jgi:hypothetical protein
MDIARPAGATAVEVKNSLTRISLASHDARDAILHFWQLQRSTGGSARFQFLTRGGIATEQGSILNRRPGIELWREAAAGSHASCELLRAFLLQTASGHLEDAVARFRAYENIDAVKALAEAVSLCESHPAFALLEGSNVGSMCAVVQACIRDAMGARLDVHSALVVLLGRIESLVQAGMH